MASRKKVASKTKKKFTRNKAQKERRLELDRIRARKMRGIAKRVTTKKRVTLEALDTTRLMLEGCGKAKK